MFSASRQLRCMGRGSSSLLSFSPRKKIIISPVIGEQLDDAALFHLIPIVETEHCPVLRKLDEVLRIEAGFPLDAHRGAPVRVARAEQDVTPLPSSR